MACGASPRNRTPCAPTVAGFLRDPSTLDNSECAEVATTILRDDPPATTGRDVWWWDVTTNTVRDENRLPVCAWEVPNRVAKLERALRACLTDLGELREGLGDDGYDDRVTGGLAHVFDACALLGEPEPDPLKLNPCPECGESLTWDDASTYSECPNGHRIPN